MESVEVVIRASERLDRLLELNFGAMGEELARKIASVEGALPEELARGLRRVATLRLCARTEPNFQLDDEAAFRREIDFLTHVLSEPARPLAQRYQPTDGYVTSLWLSTLGRLGSIAVLYVMARYVMRYFWFESAPLASLFLMSPLILAWLAWDLLQRRNAEREDAASRAVLCQRMDALRNNMR